MVKLRCYSLLNNFGTTLELIGLLPHEKNLFQTGMYGRNKVRTMLTQGFSCMTGRMSSEILEYFQMITV